MSFPLAKLGEVISFIRGVTFTPDDQVEPFSAGSTVVMRTKNVQVSGLDQSDLIAVPSGFVKRKEQSLKEGDILISSANSWELVGKASYVPALSYEATVGGFISLVRAKEQLIDSRYLYHWIACPASQHTIRHCGRQTTNISNLDVGRFKELEIPLPPLPEQKRIAAILDKADAIRRKRQQAIQLADDFLRAVFLDMFGDPVINPKGWDMKELGELVAENDRINYGIVQPGEHIDGGVPIVRVGDFRSGLVDKSNLKCVSSEIDEKHKNSRLYGDEILITCVGATIGKIALADPSLEGFNTVRAVTRVRLNNDVNRHYVFRYLQSPFIQQYFSAQLRTVGQPTLNGAQIAQTPILIPDVFCQNKYLGVATKIESWLKKVNYHNEDSSELFASLSQRAFSGQL